MRFLVPFKTSEVHDANPYCLTVTKEEMAVFRDTTKLLQAELIEHGTFKAFAHLAVRFIAVVE